MERAEASVLSRGSFSFPPLAHCLAVPPRLPERAGRGCLRAGGAPLGLSTYCAGGEGLGLRVLSVKGLLPHHLAAPGQALPPSYPASRPGPGLPRCPASVGTRGRCHLERSGWGRGHVSLPHRALGGHPCGPERRREARSGQAAQDLILPSIHLSTVCSLPAGFRGTDERPWSLPQGRRV